MTRAYGKITVGLRAASERPPSVLWITLSNASRRNAIGVQMTNELMWALEDAQGDASVRVVVITGDGEGKAFCAGGDFAQMTGASSDENALPHKGDYADLMLAMTRFEKPIVACVNGAAMGGGLGIVAASHFAIAQSDAKLGTPEVDVGLFPFMIAAVLARIVPRRALLDMMLRGRKLDAAEAERVGIVSRVVAPDKLMAEVHSLCDDLSQRSPTALRLGLRAFAAQDDLDLEHALPLLRDKLAEALTTEDAREGLTAFLQKRKPQWTGQ
jgi:enoyl-CoA hydratase/carnithine racemase